MKLVYIWFEMDKIQDAVSFNMGSKYVFSFNKKNFKLTYEDNPYYVEDFFKMRVEDNSFELNGIVGANGVGKTSILHMIKNIITGKMKNKYILVIEKNGIFSIYTKIKIEVDNNGVFESHTNFDNKIFNTIYFSNVIDAGFFRNRNRGDQIIKIFHCINI
ncbi:hypothetical protein ACSS6N_15025 [Peribacillus frigoritolerans]|uniref:hypothetical protein n=1 Tax=Peribacillus frigoritolerans TaxID=450367 RepID=UPI003F83A567